MAGQLKKCKTNAYDVYVQQSGVWGQYWYNEGYEYAVAEPHCDCYEQCECNQCTCDSMCCVNDCQQLSSNEPGEN